MRYDSFNYFALACFCLAFFSSAIAFDKKKIGGTNYRVLSTKSIKGALSVSGVPSKYNIVTGEIHQLFKGGVIANEFKVRSPFSGFFSWSSKAIKVGARGALKSLTRGGVQGLVVTAGFQALLSGVDWVMHDGTLMRRKAKKENYAHLKVKDGFWDASTQKKYSDVTSTCAGMTRNSGGKYMNVVYKGVIESTHGATSDNPLHIWICAPFPDDIFPNGIGGWVLADANSLNLDKTDLRIPVTDSDIDKLDLSNYKPTTDDLPQLSNYLPEPTSFQVTEQPPLITLPETTTEVTDKTGKKSIVSTQKTAKVTIQNVDGDLSLKVDKVTIKKTFKDGSLVDSTTEKKTDDFKKATSKTEAKPEAKQLTDCDLTPTLCKVQKDTNKFIKEPFDKTPPKLPGIKSFDFKRDYNVASLSQAVCPAPKKITLSIFGEFEISYQPFCDLAKLLKPILIAVSLIISAFVVVGVRNG